MIPFCAAASIDRGVEARLNRWLSMRLRARFDLRLQARSIVASAPRMARTAVMAPAHVPAPRGSAAPIRRRVFGIMMSLGRLTHRSEASCPGSYRRLPDPTSVSLRRRRVVDELEAPDRAVRTRRPAGADPRSNASPGRPPRRACRVAVSRRPKRCAASAMPASPARSSEAIPSRPSLGVTDTIADTRPPGRASVAMPWATRSSAPSTPRSREPHGNRIRTSSASPRSSGGGVSAAATTNSRFGRPPLAEAGRHDGTSRPSTPRRRRYR